MCWLQMMLAMSNTEVAVCKSILEAGIHADILSNLSWKTLSSEILNDPESSTKRDFVKDQINILYVVMTRAESAARGAFRRCSFKAVDVLQKFRDVTEDPVIILFFHLLLQ